MRGNHMSEHTSASTETRALGAEILTVTLIRVLGLLVFTFVFIAISASFSGSPGRVALLPGSIVGVVALIVLFWLRERSPLNLRLLYAFATLEGMALGVVLDSLIARGLSGAVLHAEATTADLTLVAGAYGATTRQDTCSSVFFSFWAVETTNFG